MPGVFISYRRDDSGGYAGRLFDVLAGRFGAERTFMDLDDIRGGDDFTAVIDEKVRQCSVLLAVIGDRWLTIAGEDGARRLDSPGDFVRIEIAKALERGVRVIPVLVSGAKMPRESDLPDALKRLSVHQAVELRDAHFHADANQLLDLLESTVPDLGGAPVALLTKGRRWWPVAAAGLLIAVVAAGVLASRRSRQETPGVDAPVKTQVSPAADIAGTWAGTVKYDWGDSHAEKFQFEVAGQEVSGTASFLGYDRGILDGKIDGNRISFTTKTLTTINNDKTYEDTHLYKGTVEGDTISVTMITDSRAESHVPVRFTIARTPK